MTRRLPVPLSVHVPGDSVLHRAPAPAKLAGLIAFILLVSLGARTIAAAGAAVALAAAGYPVARIPVRVAAWQMLGAVPVLAGIAVLQAFTASPARAAVMFLSILACVVAATLLTLTTRVSEMMDALDRALAPLGRRGLPARTVSLALSLTLRLIPLQVAAVEEVLDARRARGAGGSPAAFGVPVVIRTVRRAEAMSEALLARGVGD